MELLTAIQCALDMTRRLFAALDDQGPEDWNALLEQRATAMEDFETKHRAATAGELVSCRKELMALKRADESLQEKSREMLGMISGAFRGQLGARTHGRGSLGGEISPACLDRKV